MKLSLIAAQSKNGVIGNDGAMLWRLPSDLKKFKALTTGKIVIMGRKTFESIGSKPLKERLNVVLTRDSKFADMFCSLEKNANLFVFTTFEAALHFSMQVQASSDEVMVIGGTSIYQAALPFATRMYISTLDVVCEGDARFPEYDEKEWEVVSSETIADPGSYLLTDTTKAPLTYTFQQLERTKENK
jgi:dihydrofolate reductase